LKVENILAAKGREVETIRPGDSVLVAVHKLTMGNIGALVVSADGERVDGVLSERDVVRGLARHGITLLDTPVSSVMTRRPPVCSPDETLATVMSQMTRTRNRHLPVVEDGKLRGIVSIGDIVKHRLEEMELEANVLRDAYLARG
jgi:CBS domain-containing protein